MSINEKSEGQQNVYESAQSQRIRDFSLILWSLKEGLGLTERVLAIREDIFILENAGWTVNIHKPTPDSPVKLVFIKDKQELEYKSGDFLSAFQLAEENENFRIALNEARNLAQN